MIEMSTAPLLLSTISDGSNQDAVVVWDPVAGNSVATLSGDVAAKSTLTAVNNVIFNAVAKKPILQVWSFQSNCPFRRLTTKGVVNALTFSHDGAFMYLAIEKSIYVYQLCSGCLLVVLEASHMAPIGTIVASQGQMGQHIPLLLSADTSGVVACWPALSFGGDSVNIDNGSDTQVSTHKPLWYVVQASRSLPQCAFVADGRMVACAGTEGIKFFDSENGKSLCNALGDSRPLLSICALPHDDKFVFAGTDNGILHSVWMRTVEDFKSYEISFRRCFAEAELSAAEKAICSLSASPIESTPRILAVGSRAGLVEILRLDAGLVRLQRFSIFPAGQIATSFPGSSRLNDLLMIPRPNWLVGGGSSMSASHSFENKSDPLSSIRSIKRNMGWQADDMLFLKLPSLKRDRLPDPFAQDIYQDDFLQDADSGVPCFALPIDAPLKEIPDGPDLSDDLRKLRELKEALEKRNGDLMRILVANKLHY